MKEGSVNTRTSDIKKVLVVRADRLGDVVLSTPVLSALNKERPSLHVSLLVQPLIAELFQGDERVSAIFNYDEKNRHGGFSGFFRLVNDLKSQKFDAGLFLQNHRRISLAAWFARIPLRVGIYSHLLSYIFYNQGLRQHRSKVEKHEAEYGLDLLQFFGIKGSILAFPPFTVSQIRNEKEVEVFLSQHPIQKDGPFLCIHPGMGGSALNLTVSRYIELISELLSQEKEKIVLSFGPGDRLIEKEILSILTDTEKSNLLILSSTEKRSLSFLSELFAQMKVVVAPSTGPLHLAASRGAPVISFYPPIRVQSAKRWGPISVSGRKGAVFTPAVACPALFKCHGEACRFYFCMDQITVKSITHAIKELK